MKACIHCCASVSISSESNLFRGFIQYMYWGSCCMRVCHRARLSGALSKKICLVVVSIAPRTRALTLEK